VKYGFVLFMLITLPCRSQTPAHTETARTPRRLSDSEKTELAACLREIPGRFSIMAIADNREAYTYAQDWREVFVSAGWKFEYQDVPIQTFRISGAKWSGMRVRVHDAASDQGKTQLANDSPEWNFERCVAGKRDIPSGGRIIAYRDQPTDSVSIQVSVQPEQ